MRTTRALLAARASAGFTLVELIVILLVLGILAVFILPRQNMSVFRERADFDEVMSALQYARKAAIAKRRYVCVALSGTAVTLTIDPNPPEATAAAFGGSCPFATALALPVPDSRCTTSNQACVRATTLTSSAPTFQFDARGRASAGTTVTVSGYTPITIEDETGYVR